MFHRNSELNKISWFGGQTESASETNFPTMKDPPERRCWKIGGILLSLNTTL